MGSLPHGGIPTEPLKCLQLRTIAVQLPTITEALELQQFQCGDSVLGINHT